MSLRRRIILVIYIISTVASLFLFVYIMNRQTHETEYTSYTDYLIDGNMVYLAENLREEGILYRIETGGRVSRVFGSSAADETSICQVTASQEGFFVLVGSLVAAEDEKDPPLTMYRAVKLDDKLGILAETERFELPSDEIVTGLSAEATGLFVTTLKKDGSAVKVYAVGPEQIKAPTELDGENIRPENIRFKGRTEERFYSDAEYRLGEIYLRTDADAPTGIFEPNARVANAVEKMWLTVPVQFRLYRNLYIWYFAALLSWYILIYLVIRMFTDRNRMIYSLAVAEIFLLVCVAGAVFFADRQYYKARQIEHSRFAVLSLEGLTDSTGFSDYVDYSAAGFYNTETYRQIQKSMVSFLSRRGNTDVFYDVLVVRLRDSLTVASASGRNLESAAFIFGSEMNDLTARLYRGDPYAAETLVIDGQTYRAVGIGDDDYIADYGLFGIINDNSTDANFWVDNRNVLIFAALIYALLSALLVLVWYLQSRDLGLFENALKDTAMERSMPERPIIIGADLKEMWDSLTQINRRLEMTNYTKMRILEAYSRYAPRNIEKALDKPSIVDVVGGDRKRLFGTLVFLGIDFSGIDSTNWEADRAHFNEIVSTVGKWQMECDCIRVGDEPDLSMIRVFFLENEDVATQRVMELVNADSPSQSRIQLSALLYYDECDFGVVGTETETLTYLDHPVASQLEPYIAFLQSLSVHLVVTEDIRLREEIAGPLRHVGRITPEGTSESVELYEVLNACPAQERAMKIASSGRFDEALNLFYQKDFYLARSRFSELLKDSPRDGLIKWYLFESDKYLNEGVTGEWYGDLRPQSV